MTLCEGKNNVFKLDWSPVPVLALIPAYFETSFLKRVRSEGLVDWGMEKVRRGIG